MEIDANVIGRNGYNFLRQTKVIADKDKSELTFEERKNLLKKLLTLSGDVLLKIHDNDLSKIEDKQSFLFVLYSSIIAYVNNTDLNNFIKITNKISE